MTKQKKAKYKEEKYKEATPAVSTPSPKSFCPQCGAALPAQLECHALFERCLVKDYEEFDTYGKVHHLIVPCYMLQHNRYSQTAWVSARAGLAQVIHQGATPAELLEQNRRQSHAPNRDWQILKGPRLPGVEDIVWTFTVADVRLDSPEAYIEDAHRWAESILRDTEALMQQLTLRP